MKFILKIIIIIFIAFIIWDRLTRRYLQPYQCNMIIGKAGTGKTTYMQKLAHDYIKRGWNVYSSEPIQVKIKNSKTHKIQILQTKTVDFRVLYRYKIPPRSVLLIDELGTLANNRQFKTFDPRNNAVLSRFRHSKIIIYGFSQVFNVDKQFRDQVSQFWILERYFRVLIVARRLIMKPVVVHPTSDAPSSIQDDFTEDPKLMRPILGGMKICFLPRWVGKFDSFEMPEYITKYQDIDYSSDVPPYPVKHTWSIRRDRRMEKISQIKASAVTRYLVILKYIKKAYEYADDQIFLIQQKLASFVKHFLSRRR